MKTVAVVFSLVCAAALAAEKDPLAVTVNADKKSYTHPAGKPAVAAVTLSVKNDSAAPITLRFNGAQRYDFVLYDKAGKEAARWSAERMFAQVLGLLTLAPGDKKEMRASLPLAADGKPLAAGEYLLEGVLTATPPRTSPRIVLKIAAN